jgi:glycosyltransferase involved in cell wall biosynthesis
VSHNLTDLVDEEDGNPVSSEAGDIACRPSRPLEGGRGVADLPAIRKVGVGYSPLLTIITVVFNAAAELEATIESVSSHRADGIEFLVVDGKSTDGTLEILHAHDADISYWVSEADRGIYDAFNKAVRLAHGEWVLFLGAGDLLFDRQEVQRVVDELASAPGAVQIAYGRVTIFSSGGEFVEVENQPWAELRSKWRGGRKVMPHHQGIIQRRRFLLNHPFDVHYKIVADYKVFMLAIANSAPLFIDAIVTKVFVGGVSTDPRMSLAAVLEIIKLNRELGYGYTRLPHQTFFLVKSIVKTLLSMLLPMRISTRIIDAYRVATRRRKKWT